VGVGGGVEKLRKMEVANDVDGGGKKKERVGGVGGHELHAEKKKNPAAFQAKKEGLINRRSCDCPVGGE